MNARIRNTVPPSVKSRLRHFQAAGPSGLLMDAWNDVVLRTLQRDVIRAARGSHTVEECFDAAQHHFPGVVGQIPAEIGRFLTYATQFEPQTALEIGSATSGNSFLLVQTLRSIESLICIDRHVRNRRRLREASRHVELYFINGSSQREETIEQVSLALRGRPLDLLFIDGDHSFAGVFHDFFLYRGFMKRDGLIVFHDIVPDPRLRTGRPVLGAYAGEVPVVWNRLKEHYRTEEFVDDWSQDGLGIGVLHYDPTVSVEPLDIVR